ncbi:MAG TPA: cobalamin biosynthesis protein [bacterium]|nr:cobalamin biosynthesis protein [bacterium]
MIAITKHGIEHAKALKAQLPGAELWVSEKQKALAPDADGTFPAIKDFTAQAWDRYDGLVYHVSLGAVVRTIAPFLKGKDVDPAVVTVDDGKRFAISLLSGHVGGANELCEQVAALLGATPVVTTASDARATIPVDILGRDLGWRLEAKDFVTPVSAAVVNEKPIAFVQECGEKAWWTRPSPLPGNIRVFGTIQEARAWPSETGLPGPASAAVQVPAFRFDAWLVVSDRSTEALRADLGDDWERSVIYRPRTLCLGLGCDAGTDLDEVRGLVERGLAEAGLSGLCVKTVASIDLKANEESLRLLAEHLGAAQAFYTRDELNAKGTLSAPNPVVEKYTGAVGVSEPSAMLAAGADQLLLKKIKSTRATLAVARKAF